MRSVSTARRFGTALGCAALALLLAGCGKSEDEKAAEEKKKQEVEAQQISDNLTIIGIGLKNHSDNWKVFPAPDYGKDPRRPGQLGHPADTHWRVSILPLIERHPLWNDIFQAKKYPGGKDGSEYWLNENLLKARPKEYGGHSDVTDPTLTRFRVFVGNGAAWEPGKNLEPPRDFPDGVSMTILVVEAEEAVPWTHAAELPYDPQKPLPKLGTPGRDYFFALMADGKVMKIKKSTDEKIIRALITRDGGETIGNLD